MFDNDSELKKAAGIEELNNWSNEYEVQTLCSILNCDYEKILESNDAFCANHLLANLKKGNFESKFMKLKQK